MKNRFMREQGYDNYLTRHNIGESPHWFDIGRKEIFIKILERHIAGRGLRILDIGCGSGEMLDMFKKYGTPEGLEIHKPLAQIAGSKGYKVKEGTIENWPFESEEKFDVISFFDVLEHIKDDAGSLRKVFNIMNPGGMVVVSVPAWPILWGPADIISGHVRRYKKRELEVKLQKAGFKIIKLTFFNSFLAPLIFPFLFLKRIFTFNNRLKTRPNNEYFNNRFINDLCKKILFKEANILTDHDFVFGLSLFALARKE